MELVFFKGNRNAKTQNSDDFLDNIWEPIPEIYVKKTHFQTLCFKCKRVLATSPEFALNGYFETNSSIQ
jgi:hypothetical protein